MAEDEKNEVKNEENTPKVDEKNTDAEASEVGTAKKEPEKVTKVVSKEEEKVKKENKTHKKEEEKSIGREILEWIICIVVAFVLAVFIKYFVFTPTLVQMSSMYPTIFNNERVLVNRLVRTFKMELHHGDIVTFEAPTYNEGTIKSIKEGNVEAQYYEREGFEWFTYNVLEFGKTSYIKRIVGLPGDKITITEGKVYLNGVLLDETDYLPDGTETFIRESGIKDTFTVPEGYVFAMGDNRTGSQDCRAFGCVPIEKVEGRVVIRMWPLTKFGKITKSTVTAEEVNSYNENKK